MSRLIERAVSFAPAFAGAVVALVIAEEVGNRVRGTFVGVLNAAFILVAGSEVIDRLEKYFRSVAFVPGTDDVSLGGLLALASVGFGVAWTLGGIAVADALLTDFDVEGFAAYLATLVLVLAAEGVVSIPAYALRQRARTG